MRSSDKLLMVLLLLFSLNVVQSQVIDTLWFENCENGWNGWYPDAGVWQLGDPDGWCPDTNCFVTVLNGDYPNYADSRLISPEFVVPSADENPRLRFYEYFNFADNDNDFGYVQIQVNGGSWINISNDIDDCSGTWSQRQISLVDYSDSTVRVGFRFYSDNYYTDPGWYVDNIAIITGPWIANNPEEFIGWGDWYANRGIWSVGTQGESGPAPYSGDRYAGTCRGGDYPNYANSFFISPPYRVPNIEYDPELIVFNWFNFADNDNDYGMIYIKYCYPESSWIQVSEEYDDFSGGWFPFLCSLSDWAGGEILIGFGINTDNYYTDPGWFIDSLAILASGLGSVSGIITDIVSEEEVEYVIVQVEGTEYVSQSDADGYYYIANLESGNYNITFSHSDYYTTTMYEVEVNADQNTNLDVALEPVTGINDDKSPVSKTIAICQNYPNPFNPQTKIGYQLLEQSHVTVGIYDILGRKIETLTDEIQPAGYHKLIWDGSKHSSGIYFYRIHTDYYNATKRMLLLK